ncbi:MAG: class I SAM-dependent DNA methyltransferase [Candidatus Binataceae bacterium]
MAFYDPSTYGEEIAPVYDTIVEPSTPAEPAAEFLAPLAGRGRALELGIGTGRVAIPLAARGIRVFGIDAAPKMVERMRAKPGGDAIPVEIGDFADVKIDGKFSLIFVVFNTFFALGNQDGQIRCFERVARRLAPGGVFVIEAFVPDQSRFDRGQRVSASNAALDSVKLDAMMHDRAAQTVRGAHLTIGKKGFKIFPVQLRYAYPAELDLMARIAGMRLRERWAGWNRAPFTSQSGLHVSVYELNPPPVPPKRGAIARPRRRKFPRRTAAGLD